jgi:hypothetical protein
MLSFQESNLEKKHKKWFYAALTVSLVFHITALQFIGSHYLQELVNPSEIIVTPEEQVIRYRFVETKEQEKIQKIAKKVKEISDKDAVSDSSRNGDVRDEAPKGEKKKDIKQLAKKSSRKSTQKDFPKPEDIRKFQFEDDVNVVKADDALKKLHKTDIRFTEPSSMNKPKSSFLNMPIISFGEGTFSEFGEDSFMAAQTEAGKYFKEVRNRIELEWYRYMTFNYRTNNILGSEAVIHFKVSKDGKIVDMEKKYISGDFLFKDYCETSILNSGPFPKIPEKMDVLLKKGNLDISIYFGYDVGPAKQKKREDEKKKAE